MTDTEGTEARRSDGEETQFIQPIRDYGRAETKPLDLPRATIGGYRADAVERRVAELERRRTLDQAEIIRLKRENHARSDTMWSVPVARIGADAVRAVERDVIGYADGL